MAEDNYLPPKKKRRPPWWKRTSLATGILILLALGVGFIMGIPVRVEPAGIWMRYGTPTPAYPYVPGRDFPRTNVTYISSLASATPDLEHTEEAVSSNPTMCTEVADTIGGKYVFRLWLQRSMELYRIDADGSNLCALTYDSFMDDQAAWSPDGQRIAFVSNRDGYGIYLMNADGTNPTRLTTGGTASIS